MSKPIIAITFPECLTGDQHVSFRDHYQCQFPDYDILILDAGATAAVFDKPINE